MIIAAKDPQEALSRLKAGNERFVAGKIDSKRLIGSSARGVRNDCLAVVLSCSDMTVPAEIVFDFMLGELKVFRAPAQTGSTLVLEELFPLPDESAGKNVLAPSAPVLLMLGHKNCLAVETAITELSLPAEQQSSSPAARLTVSALAGVCSPEVTTEQAVYANVRQGVEALASVLPGLRAARAEGSVILAGAVYDERTGVVEFLQ